MSNKEELKKEFEGQYCHNDTGELIVCSYPERVFDFFWQHIQEREHLDSEISRLTALNKAAEEVIYELSPTFDTLEVPRVSIQAKRKIENYKTLKQQS